MSTIYDRIFIEKMDFLLGNGNLFPIDFTQVKESDYEKLEKENRLIQDPRKKRPLLRTKLITGPNPNLIRSDIDFEQLPKNESYGGLMTYLSSRLNRMRSFGLLVGSYNFSQTIQYRVGSIDYEYHSAYKVFDLVSKEGNETKKKVLEEYLYHRPTGKRMIPVFKREGDQIETSALMHKNENAYKDLVEDSDSCTFLRTIYNTTLKEDTVESTNALLMVRPLLHTYHTLYKYLDMDISLGSNICSIDEKCYDLLDIMNKMSEKTYKYFQYLLKRFVDPSIEDISIDHWVASRNNDYKMEIKTNSGIFILEGMGHERYVRGISSEGERICYENHKYLIDVITLLAILSISREHSSMYMIHIDSYPISLMEGVLKEIASFDSSYTSQWIFLSSRDDYLTLSKCGLLFTPSEILCYNHTGATKEFSLCEEGEYPSSSYYQLLNYGIYNKTHSSFEFCRIFPNEAKKEWDNFCLMF